MHIYGIMTLHQTVNNVIPALFPCPTKITFILTDLCDVDKCKQLFLYDKMIKS